MAKKTTATSVLQQVETDLRSFLSQHQQLIFNERELQLRIAQFLMNTGCYSNVYLEYMIPVSVFPTNTHTYLASTNSSLMRLDIVVERDGDYVAIELKFKTKKLSQNAALPRFGNPNLNINLTNQSAQDLGRYDFWRDVKRLEEVKNLFPAVKGGIALFVTNDISYTKDPHATSNTHNFSLCHGITWRDKNWRNNQTATAKGRPDIALSGQYPILPWTIANIGQLNNGSNVTPVFNYTYTIV